MTYVRSRARFPELLRCMPLILVSFTAGCATPGPSDYAAAAADYARQAQTHDALARQHEAAAEILEKQGDSEGAEISRQAMNEERRAARWDQFAADKDLLLSQW
jgi:hypothetical protein